MNAASFQDFYALFQISPQAAQMDIINGYRHAKQAYQQESLAAYSLFSDSELEDIQGQIEEAYRVLSDPEKRRSYDVLYRQHRGTPVDERSAKINKVVPIARSRVNGTSQAEKGEGDEEALNVCSGSALRSIREEKQISLDTIAENTKISLRYLKAIEGEKREHFPETVYLKGYLRQYCGEIGVEAEPVVDYFLSLLD